MNRVLRRTILKSLCEQDREDGLLSGHEMMIAAPKNLVAGFGELEATCRELEKRRRIRMHALRGVRDMFVVDLTIQGRQAYAELEAEESLALDILWVLNEVKRGELRLEWGTAKGTLVGQVMANLSQILQVPNGLHLRRCLAGLHADSQVEVEHDKAMRCKRLAITPQGIKALERRLASQARPGG